MNGLPVAPSRFVGLELFLPVDYALDYAVDPSMDGLPVAPVAPSSLLGFKNFEFRLFSVVLQQRQWMLWPQRQSCCCCSVPSHRWVGGNYFKKKTI